MNSASAPSVHSADEVFEPVGRSLRRVLVAVDRFDTQHTAVKLAISLAREHGAEVHVVHVNERQIFGRAAFELETPEEGRQLVEEAVSEIRREGLQADGRVVRGLVGQIAAVIIAEASNVGADEIIIGAKRSDSLFGRRTRERLLRHSSLPVVVAPRSSERPATPAHRVALGGRRAA
ncbi:MAG TPA: universal stress protein [Acidimicrobiales bacterium]|nr:universal stress protein [Acidimicrobiales bacterium]